MAHRWLFPHCGHPWYDVYMVSISVVFFFFLFFCCPIFCCTHEFTALSILSILVLECFLSLSPSLLSATQLAFCSSRSHFFPCLFIYPHNPSATLRPPLMCYDDSEITFPIFCMLMLTMIITPLLSFGKIQVGLSVRPDPSPYFSRYVSLHAHVLPTTFCLLACSFSRPSIRIPFQP